MVIIIIFLYVIINHKIMNVKLNDLCCKLSKINLYFMR